MARLRWGGVGGGGRRSASQPTPAVKQSFGAESRRIIDPAQDTEGTLAKRQRAVYYKSGFFSFGLLQFGDLPGRLD